MTLQEKNKDQTERGFLEVYEMRDFIVFLTSSHFLIVREKMRSNCFFFSYLKTR